MTTPALRDGNGRVLDLLDDRVWHTAAEIEEVCQVTAHSRLSDLRQAGNLIEKRRNQGATGRRMYSYRLAASAEQMDDARATNPSTLGDPAGHGAFAGSPSDDIHQGRARADGESTAAGAPIPPVAVPADPHGLEDAGWRDLYDDRSVQLELGGVA